MYRLHAIGGSSRFKNCIVWNKPYILCLASPRRDIAGPNGITVNIIHPGVIETPHIHELYEMRAKKENKTPEEIEQEYIDRTPIKNALYIVKKLSLIRFSMCFWSWAYELFPEDLRLFP